MAPILDEIAWSKVEAIIRRPELIALEVERLRTSDPVEKDLGVAERRLAEIGRLRGNLARRLAHFDDDRAAEPIISEMEALSRQERQVQRERDELVAQRASWELAQHRLQDLEYWCSVQARNLETLTYEEKRLALHAMNLSVKVWATSHSPRYEIQVELPVLGETRNLSDPRLACDDALSEAHVDDSTRRGCASGGGCRAGLP